MSGELREARREYRLRFWIEQIVGDIGPNDATGKKIEHRDNDEQIEVEGRVLHNFAQAWRDYQPILAEREQMLDLLEQARTAIEYARDQELSGRHDWLDDDPIINVLTAIESFQRQAGRNQPKEAGRWEGGEGRTGDLDRDA